jgi:glucose-1-phosphate adenylyltransferase
MRTDVVAMILAGGRGTRLNLIATKRAKPAVTFAGMYRIIDFTLTNVMHSRVRHAAVLTQYRPSSLMEHLGDGDAWDLYGREASLKILPPTLGKADSDWYKGTADAVGQNQMLLDDLQPDNVLILSGDHVYHMDYRPMIDWHVARDADLTCAAMVVPWEETSRFGVMQTEAGPGVATPSRVTRFVEKSAERISNLANMGVYVFKTATLRRELDRILAQGRYDFGKDLIPGLVPAGGVHAWPFSGYWRDVGTLGSYWSANMDAIDPASGLDLAAWRVRTNMQGRSQFFHPPAWIGPSSRVERSIVSRGCRIQGEVVGSVLSPGVRVEAGARVRDSVILHDCVIGPGARVFRSIVDKDCAVGVGASIGREDASGGENRAFPTHLSGGITVIGKGVAIPAGVRVGTNCLVGPGSTDLAGDLPDGESI